MKGLDLVLINAKNSLLLVVDVQNGFVSDDTGHVLEPINRLVGRWRHKGGQVAFSRFINQENSLYERLRGWCECRDEPQTLLHPKLDVVEGDLVMKKHTYSAWGNELAELCRAKGINTVVICGIDTNECVLATAIDVFDAGVVPIVVKDCCASNSDQRFHEAGLLIMERLIGSEQMVDSKALLAGEEK